MSEIRQTTRIVTVAKREVVVVASGSVGPQGPRGLPGGVSFGRAAGSALSGHRLVVDDGAGVIYASASNVAHAGRVLGITEAAANLGAQVSVLRDGEIVFNGWSWAVGAVFLGADGLPTQTVPTAGFSQIVGFSEYPTQLFIDLHEPFFLGN